MTRLLLLEVGEELGPASSREFLLGSSPVRLKALEPAPPFRDGEVLQVVPVSERAPRPRQFVLSIAKGTPRLRPLRDARAEGEEVLGGIVAVERGDATIPLEKGLLAYLPPSWLPRVLDALEILDKLRHPLTPSPYLGSPEACLLRVREKYDREVEARQYAALGSSGLDPLEREIVEHHVKPGGRILDIGCGAGREALGFAREGFQVVGIDITSRMVETARASAAREGLPIMFRQQSVTEIDDPPGSFDGAFWVGSYYHVPGRALRVESLGRIAKALAPDGALILTVVYRARLGLLSRSRLVDLLRAIAVRVLGKGRMSEPGDRWVGEVSTVSDPREKCFFHDFSGPGEVKAELEAAGFSGREEAPGWWVCRRALPDWPAGS
jgi:SAM-dependent methyltransferase